MKRCEGQSNQSATESAQAGHPPFGTHDTLDRLTRARQARKHPAEATPNE
jgi:hypothetical protein